MKSRHLNHNLCDISTVNDLFCAFHSKDELEQFFARINSVHVNVQFKKELEQHNQLPYLDVLIIKSVDKFETAVCRKKLTHICKTKISNYRPISLLNYDLKIFTKCFTNRLKPFMTNLSHENQYAKPGKQIFSIANLLRDLWWDASDSKIDAYFVSLDFKKAFDSIDQHWLSRVLHKMNFPRNSSAQ